MRKNYTGADLRREYVYEGKDTGPESKTEQEYLPVAVQVKRFMAAGEQLAAYKRELYDIGWDEEYNINKISVPPNRKPGFDLADAQIEMEEAIERYNAAKALHESEEAPDTNLEEEQPPTPEEPTDDSEKPVI